MANPEGPLEEVGGEWFVNRKTELDLYWQWATSIPARVKGSYALIGQRRTGKTAILHRLFNRLFWEQEMVMPVYISFGRYLQRADPINFYEFAEEYLSGYLRSYLAFRYRQPDLLRAKVNLSELREVVAQRADTLAEGLLASYDRSLSDQRETAYGLVHWLIDMPKGQAFTHHIPTAMIIDEFQVLTNAYNPDHQRYVNLTGSFQAASETHWAPLLVSGSSISMMTGEALGGFLSGRFRPSHLGPLAQEHAIDMIFRLGQRNQLPITEELAAAIWELTQGFPYPIECLLNSNAPAVANLPSLDALQEILLHELTQPQGALWSHYDEQYGKYIRTLNGTQTTRFILLWATKHAERRIFPDEVAADLGLDELLVHDVLKKLERTDVIQRVGTVSYWGPADPMMRRYLAYDHQLEVEKLAPQEAARDLLYEYRKLQGETSHLVGHLAEIIVGGVLKSFDGRTVDGDTYFTISTPVTLPKIDKLERRGGVVKEGIMNEIDLIGEWRLPADGGTGVWLVSVRHRQQKMGETDVRQFLDHCANVRTEKGYAAVQCWYVSKAGFTRPALTLLQTEGVYASDLAQFNALAQQFGFLGVTV